jgi:RNA polymerase sigma-70 factor, ECF subfamily
MTADASLVAAALEGGPKAYAPIVERYKDTVFGVAMGRLGHFHDAEDIAQSVLVEGWERLAELRDPARLGPWLRSITVHRCIDLVRSNGRWAEHSQVGVKDNPDATAAAGVAEPSALGPDAALERAETRREVLHAVASLSATQRETVTLYYLNGYRIDEVARILEVPAGTVKYRLHVARERLSERLLTMVEEALNQESPKEAFAERVFQLLNRHDGMGRRSNMQAIEELRRIGANGVEGFRRALELPHTPSRRWAFTVMGASQLPTTEDLIAMVKQGLRDPSKKVRRRAASVLMRMDLPEDRRRKEFMPLTAALLFDPSRIVRRFATNLCGLECPLELVVAARARETDTDNRRRMERLAERIAEHRLAKEGGPPQA